MSRSLQVCDSEVCATFRCTSPVLYNENIETDFFDVFDVSRAQTSLNKTVHAFGKNAYKNALMGVKAFVNRRRGLKDFHTFGLHDDTRSMISQVRHAIP